MIDEGEHRSLALARREPAVEGFGPGQAALRSSADRRLPGNRRLRVEHARQALVLAKEHPPFRQQHHELSLVTGGAEMGDEIVKRPQRLLFAAPLDDFFRDTTVLRALWIVVGIAGL